MYRKILTRPFTCRYSACGAVHCSATQTEYSVFVIVVMVASYVRYELVMSWAFKQQLLVQYIIGITHRTNRQNQY